MLHNPLTVMLEPVGDKDRLAVGGFNQILQFFQFSLMDLPHGAVLVIDRTVCHLQELPCQRSGIGRIDIRILQRDDQIFTQHIVKFPLFFIHLHIVPGRHTVRHMEVIHRFHGNRNIGNLPINLLLRSGSGDILEHHACLWVHASGLKVCLPVSADETPQTFPTVKDSNLRPQIHKSIGSWRTGQPYHTLHKRTHFPQPLETL